MKELRPRIDAHLRAFDDCAFRHYKEHRPLSVDRTTLEMVVQKWDEKMQRFRFEGILHSFTPSWIHGHTFHPVVGHSVRRNTKKWSDFSV